MAASSTRSITRRPIPPRPRAVSSASPTGANPGRACSAPPRAISASISRARSASATNRATSTAAAPPLSPTCSCSIPRSRRPKRAATCGSSANWRTCRFHKSRFKLAIGQGRWFPDPMPTLGFDLIALACLVPAALVRWRGNDARDTWFFAALALATIAPLADVATQFAGAWRTGFAASLWLTVAATMILFWGLVGLERQTWRLTPILTPILFLLGVLATVWQSDRGRPLAPTVSAGWLDAHIVFAILTYGLVTLGAVAGITVLVQERALKTKQRGGFARRLPPIADAERAEIRLLIGAEIILALNLLSGAGAEYLLRHSAM